jgi:uncharacterized membrane protein YgdD (TMEM256/DUF423 family)
MEKRFVGIAAFFFMLSIAFGAFGAHALKTILATELLDTYQVGVRYQSLLSLGLLALAFQADRHSFSIRPIAWLLVIGLLLFSFSIYGIVACKHFGVAPSILGPLTPIGGLLSIVGWCLYLFRLLKY